MPERIQLSRRKGWRKPENTVVVSRPSKWGNPFTLEMWSDLIPGKREQREMVVMQFSTMLIDGEFEGDYPGTGEIVHELAGKNLACWCPIGEPCHADKLLEVANGADS